MCFFHTPCEDEFADSFRPRNVWAGTRKDLEELSRFAKRMNLMNEPFIKVWEMYNDPNRLPEPPAEITID